jgi:hypothetical protein
VAGEAAQAVAFRWQRSQNIHLASNRRFALSLQRRFAAIRANEKPPIHILAVRNLEGLRMPAAYVSLGVISTPEDEARLSETGEEGPYLTAIAKAVLKFAGLTEDLPPKPPAPAEDAPAESSGAPEASEQPATPETEAAPPESPQSGAVAPETPDAASAGEGR